MHPESKPHVVFHHVEAMGGISAQTANNHNKIHRQIDGCIALLGFLKNIKVKEVTSYKEGIRTQILSIINSSHYDYSLKQDLELPPNEIFEHNLIIFLDANRYLPKSLQISIPPAI